MKHKKVKFIFLLICSILLLLTFDPKVFMGGDNAYYMSLAESMLHGKYQPIFQPNPKPETGVPPLYPAILAITRAIFGKSFLPAKILSFIFFILAIYLWFKFYKDRKLNEKIIYAILLFAALNPVISEYSHWEITESLFILICALSFWWYDKIQKSNAPKHWFILGLITVLAYFVRATGATISIAIFITLLIKKRWRELIWFSLANAIILAPWLIRNMILSGQLAGGAYTSQFFMDPITHKPLSTSAFITKMIRNMLTYFLYNIPILFFPALKAKLARFGILNIITSAVVLIPLISVLFKKISEFKHIFLFLLLYFTMLFMFREDAAIVRYIVPIYFLISLLTINGLKILSGKRKNVYQTILLVILIAMMANAGIDYSKAVKNNLPNLIKYIKGDKTAGYANYYKTFLEACDWIKYNTPKEAIILSRKPRLTWYFSERKSVEYPWYPKEIVKLVDSLGVDYVLIDRMTLSSEYIFMPWQLERVVKMAEILKTQIPDVEYAVPYTDIKLRLRVVFYTKEEPKTFVLKVLPKTVK